MKILGAMVALATVALLLVGAPRVAHAAAPSADLMTKLAVHAANFEKMKNHASYAVDGKLEGLARDNTTDSVKEMRARVVADGTDVKFDIVKYVEDGADKTEEAKKKQRERAQEKKKERRDIHMPFFASEQQRYTFDQTEADTNDPSRVKIVFVPKEKAEDTIEGSAWVDAKTGTVVSAGFKMSKTPTFVDYVHITVEFGAPTALGPAVSRVKMEGKGGLLFWNKVFRLNATLSDYAIVP